MECVPEGASENSLSFLLSITMNPTMASYVKQLDVLAFAPCDDHSLEMRMSSSIQNYGDTN